MAEPLPILIEISLQIAWDFLDGTGAIGDRQRTAEFLIRNINYQILKASVGRLRYRTARLTATINV